MLYNQVCEKQQTQKPKGSGPKKGQGAKKRIKNILPLPRNYYLILFALSTTKTFRATTEKYK